MKVNLTEQYLFGIIVECTSRDFLSLCSKIESLYEIKLSVVEKNVIRPILKKFLLYKKRKFGKHTVDYDVLVGMAGDEEVLILDINNDIVTDEKP